MPKRRTGWTHRKAARVRRVDASREDVVAIWGYSDSRWCNIELEVLHTAWMSSGCTLMFNHVRQSFLVTASSGWQSVDRVTCPFILLVWLHDWQKSIAPDQIVTIIAKSFLHAQLVGSLECLSNTPFPTWIKSMRFLKSWNLGMSHWFSLHDVDRCWFCKWLLRNGHNQSSLRRSDLNSISGDSMKFHGSVQWLIGISLL